MIHKYGSFAMFFLFIRFRIAESAFHFVFFLRLHHFDFLFSLWFSIVCSKEKKLLILLVLRRIICYICIHRGATNSIVEHFIGCLTLSRFERIDFTLECIEYWLKLLLLWLSLLLLLLLVLLQSNDVFNINLRPSTYWRHWFRVTTRLMSCWKSSMFNGNDSVQIAYASDAVIAFDCWATCARTKMQQSTKFSNRTVAIPLRAMFR